MIAGITNDSKDPSVDTFRLTTLKMLKLFGVPEEGLELKIDSRGVAPNGGGEVILSVPIVHNSLTVSVCPNYSYQYFAFLFSYVYSSTGCHMDR